MSVLFIVVPLAVLFAAIAVGVFVWAARSGQFDDVKTPGVRILFEDDDARPAAGSSEEKDEAGDSNEAGADPSR
jgi:cbb3-type cytochrome oxidase maturation protein